MSRRPRIRRWLDRLGLLVFGDFVEEYRPLSQDRIDALIDAAETPSLEAP